MQFDSSLWREDRITNVYIDKLSNLSKGLHDNQCKTVYPFYSASLPSFTPINKQDNAWYSWPARIEMLGNLSPYFTGRIRLSSWLEASIL